ncbi:MAG: CHASE domain-containing protein [bacterium]
MQADETGLLRAFGYDMLAEPVRRAAMEQARDMDTAALSGPGTVGSVRAC